MEKGSDRERFLTNGFFKDLLYGSLGFALGAILGLIHMLLGSPLYVASAGFPVVFLAFGRMGGFNKILSYIAVGLIIGPLIGFVGGFIVSITSFLPGIFGQALGWILTGWIIISVVGIALRFTRSGR